MARIGYQDLKTGRSRCRRRVGQQAHRDLHPALADTRVAAHRQLDDVD
jgi:hypothetical protein